MYSEVLEKYTGPEMVSFMFDGKDITDKMKALYGAKRNWQANVYTYGELFGEGVKDKGFRIDYKSEDGREHWQHGVVGDSSQLCWFIRF